MKSLLLGSLLILLPHAVCAEPFSTADAKAGKVLVTKNCISCHVESFGGDGSSIYTRENRKVKTSKALASQVRNCNTMIDLKLFEDEELNVAKYLNQTYYKFTE
jgi:mono/diheme cytochrome c family protein